jgi:hypothetical protein
MCEGNAANPLHVPCKPPRVQRDFMQSACSVTRRPATDSRRRVRAQARLERPTRRKCLHKREYRRLAARQATSACVGACARGDGLGPSGVWPAQRAGVCARSCLGPTGGKSAVTICVWCLRFFRIFLDRIYATSCSASPPVFSSLGPADRSSVDTPPASG